MKKIRLSIIILCLLCSSCKWEENDKKYRNEKLGLPPAEFMQEKDQHGNFFRAVKIGNQWWMAENLNVTAFQNGDPVINAINDKEWKKAVSIEKAVACDYEYDTKYNKLFGKYYSWYAAGDHRNICPENWRVPDVNDWMILINNLGGNKKAGTFLKGTIIWERNRGNNESGFSALPAGCLSTARYLFDGYAWHARFWTSTGECDVTAVKIEIDSWDGTVFTERTSLKSFGLPIRCIKN